MQVNFSISIATQNKEIESFCALASGNPVTVSCGE